MYVSMCMHVCVGAVYVDHKSTLGIFLNHSPPYLLRQGLSLTLTLADSARLVANESQEPPVSDPSTGAAGIRLAFYMGAGDRYLGPQGCMRYYFTD